MAESDDFEQALLLTGQDGYLGNAEVVEALLAHLWKQVYRRWKAGVASVEAAIATDSDDCRRMARLFLGLETDRFKPIPGWNTAGAIDQFLACACLLHASRISLGRLGGSELDYSVGR